MWLLAVELVTRGVPSTRSMRLRGGNGQILKTTPFAGNRVRGRRIQLSSNPRPHQNTMLPDLSKLFVQLLLPRQD